MNRSSSTSLQPRFRLRSIVLLLALALIFSACGTNTDDNATTDVEETATEETAEGTAEESTVEEPADSADDEPAAEEPDDSEAPENGETAEPAATGEAVDVGLFFDGALTGDATTEDCTLNGGAETTCYRLTVGGDPVSYETGPFCPTNITDGPEAGGIWFDGNGVYDLDGEFITNLAELYGDDNWQLYNDDGTVNVTETAEEFDLAARPDVDPSVQNHCVEGQLEWLENGQPVTSTVLIPVEPVLADGATTSRGNLGVTLDGVVIAQSAPVDAILGAYTIAAFDDCGGHYNPVDGYHLHGAVGCSELGEVTDGETPMFAYAADGFAIHSPLDDPASADLDECNGHETEEFGYHYHANNAAENQVVECFTGQVVDTGRGR